MSFISPLLLLMAQQTEEEMGKNVSKHFSTSWIISSWLITSSSPSDINDGFYLEWLHLGTLLCFAFLKGNPEDYIAFLEARIS